MPRRLVLVAICLLWLLDGFPCTVRADNRRDRTVALLESTLGERCLACHNRQQKEGGLSLVTRDDLLRGGDSGPAIVPGRATESLLIEQIGGSEPSMPRQGRPLSDEQQHSLQAWIDAGAPWPEDFELHEPVNKGTDWWSLRPLTRPAIPIPPATAHAPIRTPVDAFIQSELARQGLRPAREADRRSLIRRLYFDLIGLPPTYAAVEAFERDSDPQAYEKLVEQLLNSPQYGECWARHWLDVVHYGDTHGYDKDKLRPHAWPYRDYVIRSLNQDKPYARFVTEQLAGDVLWPEERDGIEATGFIAAGPWDFIGHAEVPESKYDGQVVRNLDRDDMVTSAINTFMSLTVQCARCHNHKFDPITQEHYYSLQAVFAALDRADREYDVDPALRERRRELTHRLRQLETQQASVEAHIADQAGEELKVLDARIAAAESDLQATTSAAFGYHSAISPQADSTRWVQIDLGQPTPVQRIVMCGASDDFNGIGAGFGFPVRFRVEIASDAEFTRDVVTLADQTADDVPNPGITPVEFTCVPTVARFVRVTATHLAHRQNDFIFALSELQVFNTEGTNVAIGTSVTALDSIEAPPRWQRTNLIDDRYPGHTGGSTAADELAACRARRDLLLAHRVSAATINARQQLQAERTELEHELQRLPAAQRVYAGTVHHGSGAFQGTGGQGGRPREIHLLYRGELKTPGPLVGPGAIPLVPGVDWRFDETIDQPEGARRVALAHWIVHHDNPLVWRSIVNRVWLYHFGRGIVDSANDFGHMGELPTHPELLDWLAITFRDGRQSLKDLHRHMVLSHAYRQVSDHDREAAAIDADNRFLGRMNRRLLSAEAIRDSVLAVAGELDPSMYGPAFMDFVIERPEHSPHYEYQKYDPADPTTHRRAIYRFLVRSQQQPFMQSLGCADPSQSVAKRDAALTSLQALTMLNNRFVVHMSERFAMRLRQASPDIDGQITEAFRTAFGRVPEDAERQALVELAQHFGLPYACRTLFNVNEFVFID